MPIFWLLAVSVTFAQPATEQWVQRYGAATNSDAYAQKIVLDSAGNVIVVGYTQTNIESGEFATIKYSNGGVPLWTNRYDGPADGSDEATAIAVDGNDNVVVTGSSSARSGAYHNYLTIKYSGAGVPLWTNRYSGPGNGFNTPSAIAVDGSGNVVVTGTSDSDYATIKYSGAGVALWTNFYNGPANGSDNPRSIGVDGSGNVFVTGTGAATVKYSSSGVPLWTNCYSGPYGGDGAAALAVDSNGDVIVTGSTKFDNSLSDSEYLTIKYSGSGAQLWIRRYRQGNADQAGAAALAVDGSGTVFVTGTSLTFGGFTPSYDYGTIAYSGAGVPLWTNLYGGSTHGQEFGKAIALDRNGNVFVTGASHPAFYDYATIAYSNAGVPMWTNRYDGPVGRDDYATSIAVDASGNVFVTGYSVGTSLKYEFVTIKYSTAPLVPIALNYQIAGNQLVLSWTNVGFYLQSAPVSQGPYTNIPAATTPYSVPLSAAQGFFRLKGN